MIGKIDRAVKEAMAGLGDELQKYLEEAGEEMMLKKKEKEEEDVKKKGKKSVMRDIAGTFVNIKPKSEKVKKKKKSSKEAMRIDGEKKRAMTAGEYSLWMTYKNYKKSHGMLAW